ncbi:uncharacterized protein CMU_006470 [Cryptosporidium muris RN66]|uniref:Uncharacterized protein n=1 Tax=Cryptosporidium muris (strain RN66) TaxID=441375 RepID=B6AHM9_CRYMR|nr:uncharacterized protein CMU_006470 [Cryptosporidium muris RN66]EEA07724.1 hypothetical protein, conserved [Cryptosporidium muris RN66]|eukprot:XP_002142073.1 hypothetical protein [Cryptosporidium muris RN66]
MNWKYRTIPKFTKIFMYQSSLFLTIISLILILFHGFPSIVTEFNKHYYYVNFKTNYISKDIRLIRYLETLDERSQNSSIYFEQNLINSRVLNTRSSNIISCHLFLLDSQISQVKMNCVSGNNLCGCTVEVLDSSYGLEIANISLIPDLDRISVLNIIKFRRLYYGLNILIKYIQNNFKNKISEFSQDSFDNIRNIGLVYDGIVLTSLYEELSRYIEQIMNLENKVQYSNTNNSRVYKTSFILSHTYTNNILRRNLSMAPIDVKVINVLITNNDSVNFILKILREFSKVIGIRIKQFTSKIDILNNSIFSNDVSLDIENQEDNFSFQLNNNLNDKNFSSVYSLFSKDSSANTELWWTILSYDYLDILYWNKVYLLNLDDIMRNNTYNEVLVNMKYLRQDINETNGESGMLMKINRAILLSPGYRKKIIRYRYEMNYRRICIIQGHGNPREISRSSLSRATIAEYARYQGYGYMMFDDNFFSKASLDLNVGLDIPRFYLKFFATIKTLFGDLHNFKKMFRRESNSSKMFDNQIFRYWDYENIFDSIFNNIDKSKLEWDLNHDFLYRDIPSSRVSSIKYNGIIQYTPRNTNIGVCDYTVWFDSDIIITNRFVSIERLLYNYEAYNISSFITNKTSNLVDLEYKDYSKKHRLVYLLGKDQSWEERHSLVNSGFYIIYRSPSAMKVLFHSIYTDPKITDNYILWGHKWPEQSTINDAIFEYFGHSLSSPSKTIDIHLMSKDEINKQIFIYFNNGSPIAFSSKFGDTCVATSSHILNSVWFDNSNYIGEGRWRPGYFFIHASNTNSVLRSNILAGLLYIIYIDGISEKFIYTFNKTCTIPLDQINQGLDYLIEYLHNRDKEKNLLTDKSKSSSQVSLEIILELNLLSINYQTNFKQENFIDSSGIICKEVNYFLQAFIETALLACVAILGMLLSYSMYLSNKRQQYSIKNYSRNLYLTSNKLEVSY